MKKEFSKLFNFFRSLTGGAKHIDIATFNKAFEGQEYMERVTASLFTYLDKSNKGKVYFEDFLMKFFPTIHKEEAKAITTWVEKLELHTENFGKMVKDGVPQKVKPRIRERELRKLKRTFNEYCIPGLNCIFPLIQILMRITLIEWQSRFYPTGTRKKCSCSTTRTKTEELSFQTLFT